MDFQKRNKTSDLSVDSCRNAKRDCFKHNIVLALYISTLVNLHDYKIIIKNTSLFFSAFV